MNINMFQLVGFARDWIAREEQVEDVREDVVDESAVLEHHGDNEKVTTHVKGNVHHDSSVDHNAFVDSGGHQSVDNVAVLGVFGLSLKIRGDKNKKCDKDKKFAYYIFKLTKK